MLERHVAQEHHCTHKHIKLWACGTKIYSTAAAWRSAAALRASAENAGLQACHKGAALTWC
jgi:hypothetical protein